MYSEAAMSEGIEAVAEGGLTSARGFVAGAVRARIRPDWDKLDVAMLYSEAPCAAAGVYTQCNVVAAPVVITRKHLAGGAAQAVIANSGCANAATGEQGTRDAVEMAQLAAAKLGLDPHAVVVASTGVIGTFLPMERMRHGIEAVELSAPGGLAFAQGIMTTDTRPKQSAVRFGEYTLGGACKGAGMIHPNMATMLAFLTTDAPVAATFLSRALKEAVGVSFNMIDVDSDTSTNDMVVVLAAVGNSGCRMEEAKTGLWLVDVEGRELCLLKDGSPQPMEEGQAKPWFEAREVRFRVELGLGEHTATAWGSDLTEEYVRLNSLYTT